MTYWRHRKECEFDGVRYRLPESSCIAWAKQARSTRSRGLCTLLAWLLRVDEKTARPRRIKANRVRGATFITIVDGRGLPPSVVHSASNAHNSKLRASADRQARELLAYRRKGASSNSSR